MSRLFFLVLLAASAAAWAGAGHAFDQHAQVRETVATTQWAVLGWAAGAAAAGAAATGLLALASMKPLFWKTKTFNPAGVLLASVAVLASAGSVGYKVLFAVQAAKVDLLATDWKTPNPPLENARPFADLVVQGKTAKNLSFLHALANAGSELAADGRRLVERAASSYAYLPLADEVVARSDWDLITRRLAPEGDGKRVIVIVGTRADLAQRQRAKAEVEQTRDTLRALAEDYPAHPFLVDTARRFDELAAGIYLQEPLPLAIEELMSRLRQLKALEQQAPTNSVVGGPKDTDAAWVAFLKAVGPAINGIELPEHCGYVTNALRDGRQLLTDSANRAKSAQPPWWAKWKAMAAAYPKYLPVTPLTTLSNLGDAGKGQRKDLEDELNEFHKHLGEVVKTKDGQAAPDPNVTTPGLAPGAWTPAGVEALVMNKMGLARWKGQKMPGTETEVLTIIQADWASLWQRITPTNTPNLSDAVRAAQAEAMKTIKAFLRQYLEDLKKRVEEVKKQQNYQQPGRFREPFTVNKPFADDAARNQLKEWLKELGFVAQHVDDRPVPLQPGKYVECTKEACAMAEQAVATFDRVCGGSSKPGDADWRNAALWWLIFYGSGGKDKGFNPFEEANQNRQPTTIKGIDQKDASIGGVADTSDAGLEAATKPKPAVNEVKPPTTHGVK